MRSKGMKCGIVASLGKDATSELEAAEDADLIEVRLDLVGDDPLESIKGVRNRTKQQVIATNRMASEGGRFQGPEDDRIEILRRASEHADYVDIELLAEGRDKVLKETKCRTIVSYHDFKGMPDRDGLRSILREMAGTGADIAKIAVTPHRLKDNLEVLDFLLKADIPLCMIAMGEIGRHIRAVAPIYGSVLTYGYVSSPTAPGQMKVSELRQALELLMP
ncbi:MAG: type I 3-dehydroquinate dehydratase [Methanotrichaceae archaeon]|nr:type I 3-dehydroquinate dehydratase [Methanotrichaceae archaeon]